MIDKPFKYVMVSYVTCMGCENNKLRLKSHSSLSWFRTSRVWTVRMISCSSFVNVSYVTYTDCECREVDEVREERLRQRREHDRRERERN